MGHTHDIVAIDTSLPDRLISLSQSGQLKIWDGSTGSAILTLSLVGPTFDNEMPGHMQSRHGRFVFFVADQVRLTPLFPSLFGARLGPFPFGSRTPFCRLEACERFQRQPRS